MWMMPLLDGLLSDLRDWFSLLCSRGPHYGYFLNHLSVLLLLQPSRLSLAREVFGDLGVRVVTGHRFLGSFIGDSSDRQNIGGYAHEFVAVDTDTNGQPLREADRLRLSRATTHLPEVLMLKKVVELS